MTALTSLNGGYVIKDNRLEADASVINGDGSVTITETPIDGETGNPIHDINNPGKQQKVVYEVVNNSILNDHLVDTMEYAPTGPQGYFHHLHVKKDILFRSKANGRGGYSIAELSYVNQTFSQVPEPAFYQLSALLALGAYGFVKVRRRPAN